MGLHAGFHHVVLNLIFRSEYKYQLNKWSRALLNKIFVRVGGGGGSFLRPEVQPLILLYTIFDRKDHKGLTSGSPFTRLVSQK